MPSTLEALNPCPRLLSFFQLIEEVPGGVVGGSSPCLAQSRGLNAFVVALAVEEVNNLGLALVLREGNSASVYNSALGSYQPLQNFVVQPKALFSCRFRTEPFLAKPLVIVSASGKWLSSG